MQFGKTFSNWFQVRGGIKESTFGFGADVLLNQGRLRLSADLFGSFARAPRLKVASALEVFHSVYLIAGIDDMLSTPGYLRSRRATPTSRSSSTRSGLAATTSSVRSLHFDDADLSLLLRVYGALIVGLL